MTHKIEIVPNNAIYIDGERVIGSKPYGMFLTTTMIVSDDDLKRLADKCLEVIVDRKTEPTGYNLSPVDKDINVRSKDCDTCRHYKLACELFSEICKYEPKTEPTTEDCDYCKMTHKYWYEHCDTCEHKSKDEPRIYGNEHNCIMTLFGDCSYVETGCGSCEVVEKVCKALNEYEHKTENSSEKPNNCDTCKYGEDKHRYAHICNECGVGINNYEPKDEPQTYITEDRDTQILDAWQVHHRSITSVEDEPQPITDCKQMEGVNNEE